MKLMVTLVTTMHTIHGYDVEVRPTAFGPDGHYDLYMYFLGRDVFTMPTHHASIEDALAHASQWLKSFDAMGGTAGHYERIAQYYS